MMQAHGKPKKCRRDVYDKCKRWDAILHGIPDASLYNVQDVYHYLQRVANNKGVENIIGELQSNPLGECPQLYCNIVFNRRMRRKGVRQALMFKDAIIHPIYRDDVQHAMLHWKSESKIRLKGPWEFWNSSNNR